jgi:predicted phage tail protein
MATAAPVVYQQGTYAPDATYRWMGSIAMDQSGDIAVGYSASSTSVYPSIRYTGRVPTDPLGTLQAETTLKAGSGSQLPNLSRWGDYSAMTVDPVDDCTFWYTTEYLKASGTFDWSTWISSFRFPGCGGSTVATAPSAPQGLTATGGDGTVTLAWQAPTSNGGSPITGYNVYRGTTPGGEGATPFATGVTTTGYTDNAVSNGTTYHYVVKAVNVVGPSTASNEASATPSAPTGATVPGAPRNLTAAPATGKGVQLTWQAPTFDGGSPIVGYNVYRGTTSGGESATPVATGVTSTSFKDSTTTRGATYYYRVAAVNAVGLGPGSSEASARAK